MRIGIYVEVARDAKPTGIGLHVQNLVQALVAIDRTNDYLLYFPSPHPRQDQAKPSWAGGSNFRLRPVRFPTDWQANHPRLWWKCYLPAVLRRDRVDVFHGPNHFLPHWNRQRSVVTIHDLAYFHMTVHGAGLDEILRDWTLQALHWANRVIALSNSTRQDLEALGVEPERIRVIYGGGHIVPEEQIRYQRWPELKQSLNLPEKYILFVGTLQPRKNVPFLVKAFARLKQETGLAHALVLAGSRDSAAAEIETLARESGIASEVIITGYVESWQLPLLYKGADLFVLPTLYEGFTLVTLEAMAYGVPVVATDTSSIREGVGESALLVPVDDVPALAQTMRTGLTEHSLRAQLIASGKERAANFTWEACARQTLTVYERLAGGAV
jgi:glycosyltransferase involved in cell wall biosynthesis